MLLSMFSSYFDQSRAVLLDKVSMIPLYIAALSLATSVVHVLWSRFTTRESSRDAGKSSDRFVAAHEFELRANLAEQSPTLLFLRYSRVVCCSALGILSYLAFTERECDLDKGYNAPFTALLSQKCASEVSASKWLLVLFYAYLLALSIASLVLSAKPRRVASVHANLLLFALFLVNGYKHVLPLLTFEQSPNEGLRGWLSWSRMAILTLVAVFLPLFTPHEYIPVDEKGPYTPNAEQTASPISFLTFAYVDRVVLNAWKLPHLPYELLPSLCDYDRAAYLRQRHFPHLASGPGKRHRYLLFKFIRIFRAQFIFLGFSLVLRSIFSFLAPISVNRILSYIETQGEGAVVRPWVWIVTFFSSPVIAAILFQNYVWVSSRAGVQGEAIFTQLLFEHALRIRNKTSGASDDAKTAKSNTIRGSKSNNLEGRLNNLMSSDISGINAARDPFLQLCIFSPLQITLCMWFLYTLLGWSALVGLATLLVGMWVPGMIAKRTHALQVQHSKATDERVQIVTETLNVIRLIKMFGYETRVKEQISEKRDKELTWMKRKYYIALVNSIYNWLLPLITMIVTFFTYTFFMKGALSASTVFSSLTVFDSLRQELWRINWSVPQIIQGKVSLDRMDDFLTNTELLDRYANDAGAEDLQVALAPSEPLEDTIGFKNAWFTYDSGSSTSTPSQRTFNLRIDGELLFKKGVLNLVTGPTGSGKTSILLALLGEMHFNASGPDSWFQLPRRGGIAYAAQTPWILNQTIRDNIIFGAEVDEVRYKSVIEQCALERDLELFEAGDATEVGEKGVTLSGGQKARISLARAVYSKAEVLLLDDILSALDMHTALAVVSNCFAGNLLRGRTVILVTHNLSLVGKHARNFVHTASDGKISTNESLTESLTLNPDLVPGLVEEKEAIKKAEELVDDVKAKPVAPQKSTGKLVVAEEIALGRVTLRALLLFIANLGGVWYWCLLWGLSLAHEFVNVILSWWLGVWSHQYDIAPDPSEVSATFYFGLYLVFVLIGMSFFASAYTVCRYGNLRASAKIHTLLVTSILSTTWRFLDQTPLGRIISRFTQDIRAVDVTLASQTQLLTSMTSSLALKLFTIVYFTPIYVLPGLALGLVAYVLGRIYMAAQLSVKREMSNARSPVYSHFAATMSGLTSIRAYGAEDIFKEKSMALIDHYTRPARMFWNLNRWIGIRIETLGGLFSAGLAAYLVYVSKVPNASDAGLQLNLAVGFSSMLIWWIRNINEAEVSSNSLERIQGYIDIDHEKAPTAQGKPPASWPTSGNLVLKGLSARYSADGPTVLHNISFSARSGEKIGVVGRTGSGKSSLMLSLLRLIPTEGEVLYDGLRMSEVNLEDLRGAVTIIPQEPDLMAGTIRQNLDPFAVHDDASLNDALRSAGLSSLQAELGENEARISLDSSVSSGGKNLSLGQRQIIALARALVRRSKLLILDEATASLDHKTDELVQNTLSTEFNDVTLIIVAHRLQTVMNADKILVLDSGRMVEFDSPSSLLKRKDGFFRALVDASGDKDCLYGLVQ